MRDEDRPEPKLDRRRYARLPLQQPLRTSVAGTPAHVIDASLGGVGVLHHECALEPGATCRIHFYSQYGPITLDCRVARTAPNQNLGRLGEEGAWRSGLEIVAVDQESAARLRWLMVSITDH